MAQKVITKLIDDIDGRLIEEGRGETVKFGLDGQDYEIDLGTENAEALREALAPYLQHGRKVARAGGAARRGSSGRSAGGDAKAAREWLRSQGHEVSARGRIPAHLLELYTQSRAN